MSGHSLSRLYEINALDGTTLTRNNIFILAKDMLDLYEYIKMDSSFKYMDGLLSGYEINDGYLTYHLSEYKKYSQLADELEIRINYLYDLFKQDF